MNRTMLAAAVMACFPLLYGASALAQPAAQPATDKAAAKDQTEAAEPQTIEQIVIQGSFLGAGSQSAMKLDVPVRDTPFSVSAYTESFMRAIETTNIADMYNYMTGVKRAGNTGYDLTIRGFKTSANDRNAIMVDGLPGLSGRIGSPPTIGVERVELVKGPMSVLYGQAQPGGFVNLIAKKPKGKRALELYLKGTTYASGEISEFGEDNGFEVAVDATGPIDADNRFLYRLIAHSADVDKFRNATWEKPLFLAPSLTWNIGDNTYATLMLEYRKIRFAYDTYLVTVNRDIRSVADIRTRYQEPGDLQEEDGKSGALFVEHTFANDWRWNLGARTVRHVDEAKGWDSVAVRANGRSLQRRARQQHNERDYDFADTALTIPLKTGPVEHKILVGVNGGREVSDLERLQFFNGGACPGPTCFDIDIYDPVYGRVPSLDQIPAVNPNTPTNLSHRVATSRNSAVYFSNLMTLGEHWKATFGARRAKDDQTIIEKKLGGVPDQEKSSSKTVPMAGVLFQPTRQWTYYVSYSTSYTPAAATAQDLTGANPFLPESAKQLEGGVKAEGLLNGRVNGTLGVYKIEKKDVLNSFACSRGTCSEQLGGEEAKGLELEVNARPFENWQITFGYAFTDAKVTESRDPAQVGARLTNSAKNSANFWSRYDVKTGMLKGLGVGFGLVYTGDRTGTLPTTADRRIIDLPAYTVADLGLYYVYDRYAFNLKIGNLFDKRYYESAGFTADLQIVPGAPRNIALSMRAHF